MSIVHVPSGLFPHMDSNFERTPYLVAAGEGVVLCCRLDGGNAQCVQMEIKDSRGMHRLPGELVRTDDRNRRYYRFYYKTDVNDSAFVYRFLTEGEEDSRWYECPILQKVTLKPVETSIYDDGVTLQYEWCNHLYRLELFSSTSLVLSFYHYFNVKVARGLEDDRGCSHASPLFSIVNENGLLSVLHGGRTVMRIDPAITLLLNTEGHAYHFSFASEMVGEALYGLGKKYDAVNQRGKKPLNYVVEKFTHQEEKAYMPIPFVFSDAGVSFYLNNTYPSSFDFSGKAKERWSSMVVSGFCPNEGNLFEAKIEAGSPAYLLKQHVLETGEAVLPPRWVFGPWMSSNGWNTQREALEQIAEMEAYGIPATVMVLEAWSDEETFYIWNGAEYVQCDDGSALRYSDFTFPQDGPWPNPKELCKRLEEKGLKLILWQIPVIKHEPKPHGRQLDLDEEYAINNRLCFLNDDGSAYRIPELWFAGSLIPDFTNPETYDWWFGKRRYLIEELGVAGFKTDGGEFLFDFESRSYDGRRGVELHNAYQNLVAHSYRTFMDETAGKGSGITFSRAGFTGAQKFPIHWAGDQMSEFSELKAQLTAGLSLGLSGVPFYGFDLGGFAGIPPETELYLRSAAFATFAPIMQFHSEPRSGQFGMIEREHWNNDRSPWNMSRINSDDRIIPIYRLFANIRMNLLPYIWQEAKHCVETARPLMAHLIYDFPEDDRVKDLEDEYMFGRDLLVAPIVEEGAMGRKVYLPQGHWYDFWTGEKHQGETKITCTCDLDRIPVYLRDGAAIPVNLNDHLVMGSLDKTGCIENAIDRYVNLAFLLTGECGEHAYVDDIGNDFVLTWDNGRVSLSGEQSIPITVFHSDLRHVNKEGHFFGRTVPGLLVLEPREDRE
jgi:alpha-D-xyloside xylohydrolase